MTMSIWAEVQSKKNLTQEEFFEFLSSISQELFLPLVDKYDAYAKAVALYIIDAYSKESPRVLFKYNWTVNKVKIAEIVSLPDNIYSDVIELNCSIVRNVVSEYLRMQGHRDFELLQMNKDLYEAVSRDINLQMYKTDKDGKAQLNYDKINENKKILSSINDEITELEAKLYSEYKHVIDNMEEVNKKEVERASSLRMEDANV